MNSGRTVRGEERSDEAGQVVGKRAGTAAAVAQEGAKRRPEATAKAQAAAATPPIGRKTNRAAPRRPVGLS